MIPDWLFAVTLATALGCGVMAGVFFAFSAGIMDALGRVPPSQGIAAMQAINVAVINPWFLGVFLGTAVLCVVLAVVSLATSTLPGTAYRLGGSLLYLVATLLVTIAFNIPRNNALAAVGAATSEGAALWAGYLTGWTRWNHIRGAAAFVAAAALVLSLS